MLPLVALGAVALVGAFVAGATWRRGADERHSVNEYHSTLETLRHVSDRVEPQAAAKPSRRSANEAAAAGSAAASMSVARAGTKKGRAASTVAPDKVVEGLVRNRNAAAASAGASTGASTATPRAEATATSAGLAGTSRRRNGRGPAANGAAEPSGEHPALVFDDGAPAGAFTPDPDSRRAIERMGHRRSSGGRHVAAFAVAAGVVVIGAGVGLAVALAPSHTTTHTGRPATHAPAPPTAGHSAPTTTAPVTVEATSSTASTASYVAPAGSYTLLLAANGLCWVMATDATTGRVLWTGTMYGGQSQSLAATGPIRVELGAASDVTMTVQGKSVVLPATFRSPFTATFTPAT